MPPDTIEFVRMAAAGAMRQIFIRVLGRPARELRLAARAVESAESEVDLEEQPHEPPEHQIKASSTA
jgi:hypothetical protein